MRRMRVDYNTEFDLDLAPLLAVMVKLVPVLLVSSAFVQMMIIETELPQVVQQAVERQQKESKKIGIEISNKKGFTIFVDIQNEDKEFVVPVTKEGAFDFPSLHAKLIEIKQQHPELFQIDLIPEKDVAYKVIVKVMDESRKARDLHLTFPVFDEKQGKNIQTGYMFPEVVFVNMTEG